MRLIFQPAVAVHEAEFELLLDVVIKPDLAPPGLPEGETPAVQAPGVILTPISAPCAPSLLLLPTWRPDAKKGQDPMS